MKKYSVIIPTTNRPAYLETALKSVSIQTIVDEIEEIIVSENLGSVRSEEVCKKFPQLPIKYIFREPQLSNTEHIYALMIEAKAPFLAMLCDDDWWSPTHLYMADQSLEAHPEAVAYFAASLHIYSETYEANASIQRAPTFWLAAGSPNTLDLWNLTKEQVFAVTWINTPFHLSSMVAKSDVLRKAAPALRDAHPWYADRILYPNLALHGNLLFNPLIDIFARRHEANWEAGKKRSELTAQQHKGSKLILDVANKNRVDPIKNWQSVVASISSDKCKELAPYFRESFTDKQLKSYDLDVFIDRSSFLSRIWWRKKLSHVKNLATKRTAIEAE